MEWMIGYVVVFLFGIIIGSFLNVCIYRIPEKETVVYGHSHCRNCGHILKWYELIPLASYCLQGGKCRQCGCVLSLQYPLIELLNGLLYLWIVWKNGFQATSILFCLCASVLLVISIIDWRTYEIPFGCNLFIGILGVIRLLLDLPGWYDYVIGFFLVSGVFWFIYVLTRGGGIGGGDIKLMAAAGLLLGWQKILLALFLGSVLAAVIHITLMKLKKKDRVLAFGPYLAAGIFLAMLYGKEIIFWYLRLF